MNQVNFSTFFAAHIQLSGDVAEIGSWQGKSTVFLAQAIKDSKNGNLFAIDHFKGNPGKEKNYEVDGTTIGLKEKFEKNVRSMNLQDYVTTLDMTNEEASRRFEGDSIRMLFIDGDHTSEGVKKDIELFFPLLKKNAIVVFDDYTKSNFCGVVENADRVIETYKPSRAFKYNNTFVMIL